MNLQPRTIADDLADLIKRVEQKEQADAKHMAEMHRDYDKKFSIIEARLKSLEDRIGPPPGSKGYRSLDEFSGAPLGANPTHSSIVDEVFKARK